MPLTDTQLLAAVTGLVGLLIVFMLWKLYGATAQLGHDIRNFVSQVAARKILGRDGG